MTLTRDQILDAVMKTNRLPSVPDLVLRLEEELGKSNPSVAELEKIIEQDPALSLRILSVANSAFYRRTKEVTSVRQAVMRLGFVEVRQMAIAATLVENYLQYSGQSPKIFWGHCLAVGYATKAISEFCSNSLDESTIESAFSAGLLHDIGVLVLYQLFSNEYLALEKNVLAEGGDPSEVEMTQWGIDHGEIGAILAERWDVPKAMCEVIKYHHRPWECQETQYSTLAKLVHLANFVCENQGFGRRSEVLPEHFDQGSWDALGLSLDDVPMIIERVKSEGERSLVFMSAFG